MRSPSCQLGTRIAQRRKAQDLTQAQLGEPLGVTQQQIASFEIGRWRIPVSTLPLLVKALNVSIEALLAPSTKPAGKRGPAPKIQQQLEQVAALPKAKQRAIAQVLESMLAQSRSQAEAPHLAKLLL